jgi:rod shape-determining protein MreD
MAEAAFIDLARLARTTAMMVLGMLAIYVEAAPLGIGPAAPPSPDLLLCVVFYWTVRRPGSAALPAVFALGLVRDALTDVPMGAGALALVLMAEAVRQVRNRLARASFMLEWLTLSAAALGTAMFLWLLTALTLTQPPYVIALFHQSLYTIMAYPLVVFAFRWGLRISWRNAGPA